MSHYVQITEDATGEVVKKMGPMTERKAVKVHRGVSVNLDHTRFTATVVTEKAAPK